MIMFEGIPKSRYKGVQDYIVHLAYISEIKEWDNRPHIERVRRYCLLIGAGVGLSEEENEMVSMAAQLHDVGKILTSEELFKKTGNYDDRERKMIERHTSDGEMILSNAHSSILLLGGAIARTHHERWDGSGYPHQLKGEEIPMSGRICAIADVFDALTTRRSYKELVEVNRAVDMIVESSGTLFDPELVRVFKSHSNEVHRINKALFN
jgi:putative two-component system response regulator